MIEHVDLLQAPAEWRGLAADDLAQTTCVVFDVLRATSSMLVALAHGAARIIPVAEIEQAIAWRGRDPGVLLAGERDGLRITAALAGVDFDLGNSPREIAAAQVRGRTIVMTTTNGTRALRACAGAPLVLLGSFLNLAALAARLRQQLPERLLLVAAGTGEQAAFEDSLAAGALCDRLWPLFSGARVGDAAGMARTLYRAHAGDLPAALALASNGARLLGQPTLAGDVAYCAQLDTVELVAALDADGSVRIL